jgi:hypothetical protein
MARQNRKKTRAQKMAGGSMLSDPKRNAYAQGGEEDGLLYETMAYLEAKAVVSNPNSSGEDQAQAQATLDTLKPEEQGGTVDPQIYAQMMQEVDAEAAKKAPVKKAEGGSMLSDPKREMYVGGSLVKQLLRLFKPLKAGQKQSQAATRGQAVHNKDVAGGIVVAGGLGYLANSDEGMALLEAADAGEIDAEIKETDERINPDDFPTYQKDTDSAAAFQNTFREAREARADTFEFEGRTYLADLPVTKKAEGGSMLVPPEMEGMEAPVDTYPNIPPEEMAAVEASQLPDAEVESDYVDFVMNEALDQEEQSYLMTALEADPQLSMIFDKVVDTASEFSGAGPVDGPGDGVSDSIPARLSAGEFVVTKKATDQIGADQLQTMMDEAERAYDGGLMGQGKEGGAKMNESMLFSNQMPSLNVRQR